MLGGPIVWAAGYVRCDPEMEKPMPKPGELREQSRKCLEDAKKETDPHLRRALASSAFTLAQLAEKKEREEKKTAERSPA